MGPRDTPQKESVRAKYAYGHGTGIFDPQKSNEINTKNIMNRIIILAAFLLTAMMAFGQKFAVESFEAKPMDLTARTEVRNDLNGQPCACIKVMVMDDITKFSNSVGSIVSDGITKKVYIPAGITSFHIEFKYHYPLDINLSDYDENAKILGNMTYSLSLIDINQLAVEKMIKDNSNREDSIRKTKSQNIEVSEDEGYIKELSASFRTITEEEKSRLKIANGLWITNVGKGLFSEVGIKKDFVIVEVNDSRVKTIEDLMKVMEDTRKLKDPVLYIKLRESKNGKKKYYAVPI